MGTTHVNSRVQKHRDALRMAGITARLLPQPANLEDVFVAATRRHAGVDGEGA